MVLPFICEQCIGLQIYPHTEFRRMFCDTRVCYAVMDDEVK